MKKQRIGEEGERGAILQLINHLPKQVNNEIKAVLVVQADQSIGQWHFPDSPVEFLKDLR